MKHLVLLGGGHAHLYLLRTLATKRPPNTRVTLVSPFPHLVYSGMVPGLVAGYYLQSDCLVPLEPLAACAGVTWVEAAALGLDAGQRRVRLSSGHELSYDVLSVDIGSVIDRDSIMGAREHALFVRPLERFIEKLKPLLTLAEQRALSMVVIGGGAAGTELALALQDRVGQRSRVSLVTGSEPLLASYPEPVQRLARKACRRQNVSVFEDRCAEIDAKSLTFGSGVRLACDAPVLAISGKAPPWLQSSDLLLDENGSIVVTATLQSSSHDNVFAAGDVSSRTDAPRPKSGVYAVRAGPQLARNLYHFLIGGTPLQTYVPPAQSLNLLACGARHAIASWGDYATEGGWVWRWKNHIDRRFVAEYSVSF